MRISFCIGGRTSENTASRTQYRSWFRGFAERLRATIAVIHSKKHRRGFDFVPTFAPISSENAQKPNFFVAIKYFHIYNLFFFFFATMEEYPSGRRGGLGKLVGG